MKVVINHDTCQHGGAFADRCLAATIRNPLGHERYCTAQVEDDGQADLTITLIMGGRPYTLVLHGPVEQEIAATEGWLSFVSPEMAAAAAPAAT